MNEKEFIRLIRESKELLANANTQQKIRLLKLIKESMRQINSRKPAAVQLSENSDYLEEK